MVYGVNFWCKRGCEANPVYLEGSRGQVRPKSGRLSDATLNSSPLRRCGLKSGPRVLKNLFWGARAPGERGGRVWGLGIGAKFLVLYVTQ